MTRRGRSVFAILFVICILVVLVLLGYFPQDILRRNVETRLQQGLGPGSHIRSMQTVPWRLRTEILDVVIQGPTYRLSIPRARLAVTPSFLLGRDLSFRSLEMESPHLEFTPAPGGKPYQPIDKDLVVDQLTLTNGTFVYHFSPDSVLTLSGVSLKGSVGKGALDVATTGGTWKQDTTVALGPATGRLRVSSRLDLGVDALEAGVGNSHVRVSGTLGRIGNLDPNLKVQARVDLRDVERFGIGPQMSGTVNANGKVSGTGDALDIEATVEGGRLKVSDYLIDKLEGDFKHAGRLRGRTRLDFRAQLLGGGATGNLQMQGSDTAARVQFTGINVDRLRRQGLEIPWPTAGEITGELTAKGDWQKTMAVTARAATAGPGPADLSLKADLKAAGSLRPTSRTIDVAFQLGVTGARPAEGALPRLRTLDLTASGRAQGPLPPAVEGTYEGTAQTETATGMEPLAVRGTFGANGGAVAFTADARGFGGTLIAKSDIANGTVRRLDVRGTDVQLALLRPEADGQANFQLNASGAWDRLTGSATAQIQDLLWNDQWIGDVTAQAQGNQGRGDFTFGAPELRASGQGTFDPRTVHAVITLDQTPVERIAALLPLSQAATGQASGTIDVTVPVANPQALVAVARLDTLDVASGSLTARATAPVEVSLRDRVVEVSGLQVTGNGVTATVSGRLGLDATSPVEGRLQFEADLSRVPHAQDLVVTGVAKGDVSLSGTRERPRASGEVALTGIAIQNAQAASVLALQDARINLQGDVAVVENLRGTIGGGTIEVTGTIPVAALLPAAGIERLGLIAGVEADLTLRWSGVQAATIIEALRPGPSRLEALLEGEARIAGTAGSWQDAHGELRLVPTGVRVQDLDLQVEPITATLTAGHVTTGGLVIKAEQTTFRVDGDANVRTRTFQAKGTGTLELRTLSPLLAEASLTGLADVDVEAEGTFTAPHPRGTVTVRDATLRVRDIPQPFSGIHAVVTLDDTGARLSDAVAQFGGGPVSMEGTARVAGLSVDDVRLSLKGSHNGILYPVNQGGGRFRRYILTDIKARVSADLALTGKPGDFLLSGSVAAERSLYDSDINPEDAIMAPAAPPTPQEASPLLQSIALNVVLATESPFVVRNNLAQLEAEGGLVLRGDMAAVEPYGRFDILPGGKVILQQREFAVEGGSLSFAGSTDPDLTVRATTVIKSPTEDVEVTVVAEGTLPAISLDLSSNPSLSQQEIASLITTGRSDVNLASSGWIVGEQALTLLTGRFTRAVARQLMDLGIDQVDIQPELIAREASPSARFTFGKQLSRDLRLVYSAGLSNPEEQYYEVLYQVRVGQQITLKFQRRFDGTYNYGLGQRLSLGGPPRVRQPMTSFEPTTLKDVRLDGELVEFPDLLQAAKVHAGRKVTYFDLLDDADRLRQRLVNQGYLEAVVDARLDDDVGVFTGVAGQPHRWRVEGMSSPPDIDPILKGALYEEEGIDRVREAILAELRRRGHLRANVDVKTSMEGGYHTMIFEAQPGPVLSADVTFPGALVLSPAALLDAAGGPATLLTRPRDAEEAIRVAYGQARHLQPRIGPTRVAEEGSLVRIAVPVEEGPEAKVASVKFNGATLPVEDLAKVAAVPTGGRYDPAVVDQAVLRIRDRYLGLGYATVHVTPRVEPAGPDLDVVFDVREGQAQTVGPVRVTGLRRTRESLVRGQLDLKEGGPLDPRKIASTERRLRDLGIFRRAVVTASADNPAVITIELEEGAPYDVAYDARYNQRDALSISLDNQLKNLFGKGMTLGLRVQGGRWLQEGRASFHVPSVLKLSDITFSVYYTRATIRTAFADPPAPPPPLNVSQRIEQGLQLQQAVHRFHPFELLYGYRYRRTTCPGEGLPPVTRTIRGLVDPCDRSALETSAVLGGPDPITLDLGALDGTVVLDTRDSPLNPTRGLFVTANLQLAPRLVRSDFDYVREYIQGSLNLPIGETVVWAQRYSIGAIHTFGGERLPFNELFKAGGANTVRGFATDSLGPRTLSGDALGGAGTLIVNEEVRYQHPATGIGAALFYDAGNVFSRARDLGVGLRHSVGFGVRWDSGFGLLRIDLAFPLNRRPTDRSYQFWFGFGQVF